MYDLIIIGGGPAGSAAAVYAARKQLKTSIIAKEWGGQSIVSPTIYNWIGTPEISGDDLAKSFREHIKYYEGEYLTTHEGKNVTKVSKDGETFSVEVEGGETFEGGAVLVTSGSRRRKLTIPGAEEFENRGVVYCASCDGPLFSGKEVVVVGGGNAGFETAAQLLAYCPKVTLLQRSGTYKADPMTVKKVLEHENMVGMLNTEPTEIIGETMVTAIKYKNSETGEEGEIPVGGVFSEIGQIPNTDFVEGLVELDEHKRIPIDHKTQQTKVPGIWAAGDATDVLYHQNNISAGDAVKAVEDIYKTLKTK